MKKKTMLLLLVIMVLPFSANAQSGFTLTSPDLGGQIANAQVFNGFGCKGENISPELLWENAPEGTKSFAVTVYDPDAPTGSGWWHWVIYDIPKHVSGLKQNSGDESKKIAPAGSIQSITSFGSTGYGGACPPQGDAPHAYIFTVHALKVEHLGLKADVTPAMVGYYLGQNTLEKASTISYFSR